MTRELNTFRTWYGRYFLFAVYQKLAESESFCVRKVYFLHTWNFSALVRKKRLSVCNTRPTRSHLSNLYKIILHKELIFSFWAPIIYSIYYLIIIYFKIEKTCHYCNHLGSISMISLRKIKTEDSNWYEQQNSFVFPTLLFFIFLLT